MIALRKKVWYHYSHVINLKKKTLTQFKGGIQF